MIVEEKMIINEKEMVKHYSDKNVYIKKVGTTEEYGEAIDIVPCRYSYEETDKKIESEEGIKDGE